jgi:glycosyltransferase involved in cell wall biosynthesis
VTDQREGVLYDPPTPESLASALESLLDPARRKALGAAARNRVVADFSWAEHCRRLEIAMQSALTARRGPARGGD